MDNKAEEAFADQEHIEDKEFSNEELQDVELQDHRLSDAAADQARTEQELCTRRAIQAYPMAIFWCLVVSMCVIMEGYDTILIGNLFAFPSFQIKYGNYVGISDTTKTGYQITAGWQAALSNASGIGAFFGVLLNGYLVNIFGQKKVVLGALMVLSGLIFMTFFAPNIKVLFAGEVLCGLPWGVFATTAPAYASELLPMSLRVYFTSWTNMCFITGQLIAAGVLEGLKTRLDEWGYRIPFAVQWVWPAILIPLICFAPESPWHLVRHNRLEEAEHSLKRVVRASANIDTKKTLAAIIYTNKLEEELSIGTSYWDCFQGVELRRTEISCMAFAGQIFAGLLFAYNSTYFFEQLGLNTSVTYSLNVGGNGLALFGTFINWFAIMPYFGRRTIYLNGLFVMVLILFVIGIMNIWTNNPSVAMGQAVLTLVWTLVFQLSVGQLGWALPAEMGSTRLRQKTICLARNAYYLVSVVGGVLEPYFMNPQAWDLRGYTGFIWAGTAGLTLIWAYFRLPETKDRNFEDLDILFAHSIPARKFKTTTVDAFDPEITRDLPHRDSATTL